MGYWHTQIEVYNLLLFLLDEMFSIWARVSALARARRSEKQKKCVRSMCLTSILWMKTYLLLGRDTRYETRNSRWQFRYVWCRLQTSHRSDSTFCFFGGDKMRWRLLTAINFWQLNHSINWKIAVHRIPVVFFVRRFHVCANSCSYFTL